MVLSAANIDLGTTENSYSPTASLMSISGRDLHTTIIRAKSERSSFNSITLSWVATRSLFPVDFHVSSFRFFIGDQMLCSADWIRSFTKLLKSSFPMVLCSLRSFLTFSGLLPSLQGCRGQHSLR